MRSFLLAVVFSIPSLVVTPSASAQPGERIAGLDSLASATLNRALEQLGIAPAELGFDKLYAEDDTFRLAVVERLLGDPLALPGWQTETVARARATVGDPVGLAEFLGEISEATGEPIAAPYRWPEAGRTEVWEGRDAAVEASAESLRVAIGSFLRRVEDAGTWLDRSFRGLSPGARESLLVLAPAFWGEADHPGDKVRKGALHFELGLPADTTIELTEKAALDAAAKLDRAALTRSAELFTMAWVGFADALSRFGLAAGRAELAGVTGTLAAVEETPYGLLVVGGPGANLYSAEAMQRIAFLFEPGGDDRYRGRAASALGGLLRPFSVLVDVAGDDLYEAGERAYAIGGALFGVAALVDLAGDDIYRGDDGSLGAGFFGAGFLYDGGGNDLFEGRNLTQGAGAFGIGALVSDAGAVPPPGIELQVDRAYEAGLVKVPGTGAVPVRDDENDTYLCARQGQGFASTFGAGLLYDRAGNDTYRSGGTYLHAPLLPNDFQSLSQGFSIGFRPRAAGGVGMLIDEEGNDFYDAEVYAQGVSYWYSVGLLHDRAGNDRYLATQYAQGAGVHLAVGSLWDGGGDDQYVSKFGVTQGTAHDLSVGLLLDEGGNDSYLVSDGQGVSITNSVALFIDSQGDDIYATARGGQGKIHWARGFCGAGIFLDLEGSDRYPAGAAGADGATWVQDAFAIGIDLDRDVRLPDEVVGEPVLTAEDSLRSVEELFETASIWEVGSAREKVRRARKALIAKGIEAVDYAAAEKMGTDSGLEYRAIRELAEAYPDSFAARLLPRLAEEDERVVRNTIRLLGDLKRPDARGPLERLLGERSREKHWTRAIQALGRIGKREAAGAVRPFLAEGQERRRIVAAVAVTALRDTVSVPALVGLLEDPLLTVRAAASRGLESFAAAAVEPLAGRLGKGASQERLFVRTLGRIAGSLADSTDVVSLRARARARGSLMRALERAWEGKEAPVRAAAVEALFGLGDEETRAFVRLRMADEYDPLVLRTYERAEEDAGR